MTEKAAAQWEDWNGVPVPKTERDQWAEKIASAEGVMSIVSGDSAVFGEVDVEDGEAFLVVTDYEIRRDRRVPLPPDSPVAKGERLRRAASDLYRALAEYVAEVDRPREPSWEWSCANLQHMRDALAKAEGREP